MMRLAVSGDLLRRLLCAGLTCSVALFVLSGIAAAIQIEKFDPLTSPVPEIDTTAPAIDLSLRDKFLQQLEEKEYAAVLRDLEQLAEKERDRPVMLSIKASALVGQGKVPAARDLYLRLRDHADSTAEDFVRLAGLLLSKGVPQAALPVVQAGLLRDGENAELLYQMGYAYQHLGRLKRSQPYLEAALVQSTAAAEHALRKKIETVLALVHYQQNDYEQASQLLKERSWFGADLGLKLIIDAKQAMAASDFDRAHALLDEALTTPRRAEAMLTKAQGYLAQSQPQRALDLLAELEEQFGRQRLGNALILSRALAHLIAGEAERSLGLFAQLAQPQQVPNLPMLKAIHYFSQEKPEAMAEELRKTVLPFSELAESPAFIERLSGFSAGPRIALAYFCLDQNFLNQAQRITATLAKEYPDNILVDFLLAESSLRLGDFDQALAQVEELQSVFPESYGVQYYLSQAYARAGRTDKAVQSYASLVETRPDLVVANLAYGQLLREAGRTRDARDTYLNALNYHPESAPLLLALGWALAELNDLKALKNLTPMIDNNQDMAQSAKLHLLGWCASLQKDLDKAESMLYEALEQNPGDPEICFHLGTTLMARDKTETGRRLLQQSFLFDAQREKYQASAATKP